MAEPRAEGPGDAASSSHKITIASFEPKACRSEHRLKVRDVTAFTPSRRESRLSAAGPVAEMISV